MAETATTIPKKGQLLQEYADLMRYAREKVRLMGREAYVARATELRRLLESMGVEGLRDVPNVGQCRLQPLADHVVVRPAAAKTTTDGGLVIPDSAQEVPMRGTVLAVGPGAVLPGIGSVPVTVQVGQDVLFGRYAGVEVRLDDEDVRIMREEDILGILAPEAL